MGVLISTNVEYGRCTFVNADGTVMVPCWKFNNAENMYNLLEHSIEDVWSAPQWEIAKTCHDCQGTRMYMVFFSTYNYIRQKLYEWSVQDDKST